MPRPSWNREQLPCTTASLLTKLPSTPPVFLAKLSPAHVGVHAPLPAPLVDPYRFLSCCQWTFSWSCLPRHLGPCAGSLAPQGWEMGSKQLWAADGGERTSGEERHRELRCCARDTCHGQAGATVLCGGDGKRVCGRSIKRVGQTVGGPD
jgi:hypothetical protein